MLILFVDNETHQMDVNLNRAITHKQDLRSPVTYIFIYCCWHTVPYKKFG